MRILLIRTDGPYVFVCEGPPPHLNSALTRKAIQMQAILKLIAAVVLIDWIFSRKEPIVPAIQKDFEDFHSRIKLDDDDENAKLREKRDTLIKDLRANLPDDVPAFSEFSQGSYAMNTGVVPRDGNYDIDVGLLFDCKKDKYTNPVELKKKVRDALTRVNRTVNIRRPCVTVTYLRNGEPDYHVDLAVYVKRSDACLDIAMGKENSTEENRVWEISDPKELTKKINDKYSGQEGAQYRRSIRYLKRWRNNKFTNGGAPLSIALTTAAYHWFQPYQELSGKDADLKALKNLTTTMLNNFSSTWHEGETASRLEIKLPVEPRSNLMSGMTNLQMTNFKERLTTLRDELIAAEKDELPEDACRRMKKQFGDEFHVPEPSDTAKAVPAPYISTGTSA